MKKIGKIHVTVTNNFSNFKLRLPLEWLKLIGITENYKELSLLYKNKALYITKKNTIKFGDLTPKLKAMQLKKFELTYGSEFGTKKELLSKMEEYFGISYRTVYRLLKEEVTIQEISNTILIDQQESATRNINIMFSTITKNEKKYIVPTLTIPTNLAVLLLEGKTYEDLQIKSAYELYKENISYPVELELDARKELIKIKSIV